MVFYGVDADTQFRRGLLVAPALPAAKLVDLSSLGSEGVEGLVDQRVELLKGGGGLLLVCRISGIMKDQLFQQMAFPCDLQGGVVSLVMADAEEIGGEGGLDVQLFPGVPELKEYFVYEVFGQLGELYEADEVTVDVFVVAAVEFRKCGVIVNFQTL